MKKLIYLLLLPLALAVAACGGKNGSSNKESVLARQYNRPGRGGKRSLPRHTPRKGRTQRPLPTDRFLHIPGSHWRWQNGACPRAFIGTVQRRIRNDTAGHERIYGTAQRKQAYRLPAGLRWIRRRRSTYRARKAQAVLRNTF